MNLLIIDTSYFNFYRFYATLQWYKNAYPEEDLSTTLDLSINQIFIQKFEKMFLSTLDKFKKKFKINKIIFARDCPRKEIWRTKFYPDYKIQRDEIYSSKNNFQGGCIFKYAYKYIIPKLLNESCTEIKVSQLEADDIIYLTTQKIKEKYDNIYIISSDHDLLQVIDTSNNIFLYDAKLKCFNDKSYGSSDKNNFIKSIIGDSSDNIKQIIPKLGVKTALKIYDDKKLLLKKFKEHPGSLEKYCLNRILIDFKNIPDELKNYFNTNVLI